MKDENKNNRSLSEVEAKVDELKKKHGEIFRYTTIDGKIAYFKAPDRKTLGFASSTSNGDNIMYKEIIANNCFVDGDREILENDKYFLAFSTEVLNLVEVIEGTLEKL